MSETAAAGADLDDPAYFIQLVRFDWLVSKSWNRLHWAEIPEEYWQGILQDWAVTEPIRLACGRMAAGAWIPGMFTRGGAERCKGCCRATGLPEGAGSPKNSQECRVILGLPVAVA